MLRSVAQHPPPTSSLLRELGLRKRKKTLFTEGRAEEEARKTVQGPAKTNLRYESPQPLPIMEAWLLPQCRQHRNSSSGVPEGGRSHRETDSERRNGVSSSGA